MLYSIIDNIQQILKPVDEDSFNKAVDDFYKSQQTTAWIQSNVHRSTRIAKQIVESIFDQEKFDKLENK